jgi:hypothetical protein
VSRAVLQGGMSQPWHALHGAAITGLAYSYEWWAALQAGSSIIVYAC